MVMSVRQIGRSFAAEIIGVDARVPPAVSIVETIEEALARYPVICLRDQKLDDEQQYRFVHSFGPKFEAPYEVFAAPGRDNPPPLMDVGTLDHDGQPLKSGTPSALFADANQLWHTDGSYSEIPIRLSGLSARSLPRDPPDTLFADMRAAWDALPEDRQRLCETLRVEHSIYYSRRKVGMDQDEFTPQMRARFGVVAQPLVRIHSRSGRKSLYLAAHAGRVVGWDEAASDAFLEELTDFATQPRFVYAHRWRAHDLLIWDDSATMHRATPYPYDSPEPRILRWAAVQELAPLAS
jgi:alpha-ketoglutarate-dependent 2,4-dichlorophenoxyacetate dioxygenase